MTRALVAALAAALLALPATAAAKTTYYLSLGDSYASGVQPIGPGGADTFTNQGYTDVVYNACAARTAASGC